MNKVPPFIKLIIPTIVLGFMVTIGFAWEQNMARRDRMRDLCEMSVRHRDDDRALAQWAVDNVPNPRLDYLVNKGFIDYMDARLPPLHCEEGMAVPEVGED